jgi:xanthine dehydrogenase accessory factor
MLAPHIAPFVLPRNTASQRPMTSLVTSLKAFFAAHPGTALVEVTQAKGSTPREKGAWMLVSPAAIFGTIGGGQLEFMAIDKARQMLARALSSRHWRGSERGYSEAMVASRDAGVSLRLSPLAIASLPPLGPSGHPPHTGEGTATLTLDIPLGPEIGQCCGGRVEVSIRAVDDKLVQDLMEEAAREDSRQPHVYVFGGGHVGHALATAFALLPVHAVIVETRAEALEGMPPDTRTRLTPVPEEMVAAAPPGSAFVVLTHDHALDFLIVAEALKRNDAAYVGMIGSKTKKATFRSWYMKTAGGTEAGFLRLVSPIGGDQVKDKRPPVIAALAAAEIMTALAAARSENASAGA